MKFEGRLPWKCVVTEEPDIYNLPDSVEVLAPDGSVYRGTLWVDYYYCQVREDEFPSIQFDADEGEDTPITCMSLVGFDKWRELC